MASNLHQTESHTNPDDAAIPQIRDQTSNERELVDRANSGGGITERSKHASDIGAGVDRRGWHD